ncbi:family 16 glycosylhydrolase [Cellvibrio sp. UBA7661]|uniref:family 16 glycosylhydrolase n=1 Tax=Cellvibrio sp. UBA7661 TaxID=1946311 RepID=UPI002F3504BD
MKFSLPLISYISVVCIALTACGGGSSDNKNNSSSKVAQTGSSNAGGVTESSTDASSSMPAATVVLSGRVAIGAAIPNATVVARCADGSGFIAPVVTDINGGYQGTIPATASLPCALQARGGQPEVVLHSYATSAGNVNITVLTDLILAGASGQSPATWFDSSDWQSVGTTLESTQAELARQLAQSGYTLDSETFSPFTVSFVIGDAHDQIMDRLQEAIAANGDLDSYEDLLEQIKSGKGLGVIPPVPASSSSSAQTSSVQTSLDDSPVPDSSSSSSLSSSAASSVASSITVVVPAPSSVPASSVAPSSVPASSVAPSSEPASSVAPSSVPASSSSVESSSVASSSTPASSSAASSSTPAWNLVWEDEFEGTSIDSSKWEHEVNCWGGGNNEAQCYVNNPANSFVTDGLLNIKAIQGHVCGPAKNQEDPGYNPADTSVCKDYSSARLRTKGKADWKYGRMEIRAKMPSIGGGVWPAIWMLPTDTTKYGSWPHSGEIDIMEAFQPGVSGAQPTGAANEIHGTLHYGYSWPMNQYSGASYEPPTNIWDDFHTYAVEWEEGEIRWYVDNVLFARNSGNWFIYYWGGQEVGYQVGTGAQPFDQPFHMILNVALGNGSYVPYPTFGPSDNVTMEVDFVKVYECSADPVTGKGCETPTADPSVIATEIAKDTPPPATWDTRWLYKDGLQTLSFDINGAQVPGPMSLGSYACPSWESWCPAGSSITVTEPNIADGPGGEPAKVLDLAFAGISNAFIIFGEAGSEDALDFGGSISEYGRAVNLGEIKFDMRVLDIDANTKLRIKLDSGYPNNSYHEIEIPAENEWAEVSVRLYTLLPNTNEGYASPVNFKSIKNPFVIEPVGGNAHVQLNNIRFVCQDSEEWGDCNIKPVVPPEPVTEDMDIFVGGLDANWSNPGFGVWQADGQVITIDATVNDPDKGTVTQVAFTPVGMGTFYIQGSSKDLSAFAAGDLVFDLKVVSNTGNTSGFLVKADCGFPCVGAEIPVPLPADNNWHTITVPIASIAAKAGFDITKVNTPFSLWPVFGQQNVTFQVANVRWRLPQ